MTSTRDLRDQVDLFRIAEGFLSSSVLFALVRLDVFEHLGASRASAADLAGRVGASPEALSRLLDAGVRVGVLEPAPPSGYRVSPKFSPYLVPDAGGPRLDRWFRFQAWWYEAFGRLDECARTGRPSVADYLDEVSERREMSLAMHDYAALRAGELVAALDADTHRSLLDVGCGPGTYAFELGRRHPSLALHLADLAEVLDVAREVAERYDLPNEVHYHPIDIVRDDLPAPHDLVLVSNTLHVLGEAESRRLIRRLYEVVEPGGMLVVQAQHLGVAGKPPWAELLDLAMLCTTRGGKNHSAEDTRRWMEDAGFVDVTFRALSFFNPNSCVRGVRP